MKERCIWDKTILSVTLSANEGSHRRGRRFPTTCFEIFCFEIFSLRFLRQRSEWHFFHVILRNVSDEESIFNLEILRYAQKDNTDGRLQIADGRLLMSFWGTLVTKNLFSIWRFFASLRMTFSKPPLCKGRWILRSKRRRDCKNQRIVRTEGLYLISTA